MVCRPDATTSARVSVLLLACLQLRYFLSYFPDAEEHIAPLRSLLQGSSKVPSTPLATNMLPAVRFHETAACFFTVPRSVL